MALEKCKERKFILEQMCAVCCIISFLFAPKLVILVFHEQRQQKAASQEC
jgi:hypothetical protein